MAATYSTSSTVDARRSPAGWYRDAFRCPAAITSTMFSHRGTEAQGPRVGKPDLDRRVVKARSHIGGRREAAPAGLRCRPARRPSSAPLGVSVSLWLRDLFESLSGRLHEWSTRRG